MRWGTFIRVSIVVLLGGLCLVPAAWAGGRVTLTSPRPYEVFQRDAAGVLYRWAMGATVAKVETDAERMVRVLTENCAIINQQVALIEQQKCELQLAAPKVAFCNDYADATGLTTLSNAAKELGIGPRKLTGWLCAIGACFHQGGRLVASQGLMERGLFADKTGVADNGHKYGQTYLTPKGLLWVAEKWAECVGPQPMLAAEALS